MLRLFGLTLLQGGIVIAGLSTLPVDAQPNEALSMAAYYQDKPKDPEKPDEPEKDEPETDEPETDEPEKDEPEKDEPEKADDTGAKAAAKKSTGSDKKEAPAAKKKKRPAKTIETVVKTYNRMDGLFPVYQDPKTGKVLMELSADQLGEDYIYTSMITDGVVRGGHFRGQYRAQRVLTFRKYFERIEILELNSSFYFDPENPLSKAKDANISDSLIGATKIMATTKADEEDETSVDRYLIQIDGLLLSEALDRVKAPSIPGSTNPLQFSLGKLARGRSKITEIKNFPQNVAFDVDFVYANPNALNPGGPDVTDARNVTIGVQHMFVEMPNTDFKPRFDDPRIGFFTEQITDLTSQSATPYRDVINRWHLVKKDPDAAVSDPIEPIVWWIENTTPKDLRPIIKKAGQSWNLAFEAAGFSNVIEVREQPDDADWDATDLRYNVLRWTSSPDAPFGGYGPSIQNPLTGQILGADIMLEYSFLTNRLRAAQSFEGAALPSEFDAASEALGSLSQHMQHCALGSVLHQNIRVGQILNQTLGATPGADRRILEEALYYLILHEIGHTLGLSHNMKATQARPYETAHDIDAQEDGLIGSVMDYPALNFAPKGQTQAHYAPTTPGPYDLWAIEFGYSPDLDDPAVRAAHLARSTEPGHEFGNDADDMRAPGFGIDPRVNIYDFSDDALRYSKDRLELDRDAMAKLQDRFTETGEGYQGLRNAFLTLTSDMAWQGRVISRYVGGVYVDRSVAGQKGAKAPYRPVEVEKQEMAMALLKDYIFAPDAFMVSRGLLQRLAIQRRSFNHFGQPEDPKMHGRVLAIQNDILDHLLHPFTLTRITDSGLYGNDYTVTDMMADLTNSLFEADSRGAVNTMRQGLQLSYVRRLIVILNSPNYDYVSQSNAFANLRTINRNMARWRGNAATRAHRDHISFLIQRALETLSTH